ncbi:hypothetical protein CBR_g39333 [Chara braunii]|uniref:Myb-like domain-containing protein n=1 Tax=Chara braunii TaxID=69332 RepID=A0A388K171_CHABU|nr:hypothetical protein CBR_g39333 [Chara braunii]|eukprot:GBG63788.1 hypothetical protein CBR_g39333 [Chara braunii]
MMGEDDPLMADANGQHQFMKKKERYAWVADPMASGGYPQRTVEDCRKKWTTMLSKAKLILDKCKDASGLPLYWDTDLEKQKELKEPLAFEKPLSDAMQWKVNRPSMTCDQTLSSEDLPGVGEGTPPSRRSGSEKMRSQARGTYGSKAQRRCEERCQGKLGWTTWRPTDRFGRRRWRSRHNPTAMVLTRPLLHWRRQPRMSGLRWRRRSVMWRRK